MKFKRYSEIINNKMDLHLHTNWTDGKNSMEEMIATAEKLNLTEIAFTDHVRKTSSYYGDYINAVFENKKKTLLKIFVGYEAKILDFNGRIDVSGELSKVAEIKIASVHRFPIAGGLCNVDDFEMHDAQKIERELSIKAIENNNKQHFNVLGHCGGMSISRFGEFPIEYFTEIIKRCAEYDIAFEVNYRYHKVYLEELKKILKRYNPYVTFGTDAHKQEDMKIREV